MNINYKTKTDILLEDVNDCNYGGFKMTEEVLEMRIDSLEDQVESLQKKLEIATKALKYYAEGTLGSSVAQQALKEMEEV